MNVPNEFFTPESMVTFTGATAAVFVIGNTAQSVFQFNPRWFSLLVAEAISLLAIYLGGGEGLDYLIGLINGCLIYSAATGAVAITGTPAPAVTRALPRDRNVLNEETATTPRRRFSTAWW
jgi:hypothetical protein